MVAIQYVEIQLMTQASQEIIEVLLFRITPLQLAQGGNARHHLPFHFHAVLRPFSPDTALYSDDACLFFGSQLVGNRFEIIHACHTAYPFQAVVSRVAEIKVSDGADDGVMSQPG